MLTAIRYSDNKKVIGALIEKDKDATYYCEYCEKEVIHHKSESQLRVGHFKHKKGGSHCPNQTKETEWHYETKYDIFNYIQTNWGSKLEELEVEKWICNNSIRPDIYIRTLKNKIAIEVQATILTISEIKRRTVKYFKNGISVMWILPFEFERLHEYQRNRFKSSEYEDDWVWRERDKVRFKEMEIWLYWAYFKKLIFWDLKHKYSKEFIFTEFTEYKSDDVEFRRDGEEHFYYGKTAKTLKSVETIWYDIPFSKLTVSYSKEFEAPFRNYVIPERKIFTFDNRRRKNKYGR